MKTITKIFALSLVILGFSTVSFAQNSANTTASASGTIYIPLNITKSADLGFGNIVNTNNAGGTVTVPVSGSVSYSGVAAFTGAAGSGSPAAASFSVTGNNSNSFAVSISGLPASAANGSNTMALSAWTASVTGGTITMNDATHSGSGAGQLSSEGAATIKVGATLTVAASQAAGTYTTENFTVTVNYN
jgi:hypothetical protein